VNNVQRLSEETHTNTRILGSNIDDAIDRIIDPGNGNEEDEFEQWQCRGILAANGNEHARSPIKYWVKLPDRYSNLSKLAIDVLSIPASSCECECCFSEFGDLLEPRRRGISPELLAIKQCTRR
jgi:hypothetical protein